MFCSLGWGAPKKEKGIKAKTDGWITGFVVWVFGETFFGMIAHGRGLKKGLFVVLSPFLLMLEMRL